MRAVDKDSTPKFILPGRDTYESNTPKDEDTGVPDTDKDSRIFLEHVTWFVSSWYVAFGRRTGNTSW